MTQQCFQLEPLVCLSLLRRYTPVKRSFNALKKRVIESHAHEATDNPQQSDALQGYNLDAEQHALLANLLRQEELASPGSEMLSVSASLTIFELTLTLKQTHIPVPAVGAPSISSCMQPLWLVMDLQRLKLNAELLQGAINALLTCDQIRVADRAPGAAAAHVWVLTKRVLDAVSVDDADA